MKQGVFGLVSSCLPYQSPIDFLDPGVTGDACSSSSSSTPLGRPRKLRAECPRDCKVLPARGSPSIGKIQSTALHGKHITGTRMADILLSPSAVMTDAEISRDSVQRELLENRGDPARTVFFTFPEDDHCRKYSIENLTYTASEDAYLPRTNGLEGWVTPKLSTRSPRRPRDDGRTPSSLYSPPAVHNLPDQAVEWWKQHEFLAPGLECLPRNDTLHSSRVHDRDQDRTTITPAIKLENDEAGDFEDKLSPNHKSCATFHDYAWINDLHTMPMLVHTIDGRSINPDELQRQEFQECHNLEISHKLNSSSPISTDIVDTAGEAMWHALNAPSEISENQEEGTIQAGETDSRLFTSPKYPIQDKIPQESTPKRRKLVLKLVDSCQRQPLQTTARTRSRSRSLHTPRKNRISARCGILGNSVDKTWRNTVVNLLPRTEGPVVGDLKSFDGVTTAERGAEIAHDWQLSLHCDSSMLSPDSPEDTLYRTRSAAKLRKYSEGCYTDSVMELQSTQSTPTISAPESHDDYARTEVANGPSSAMKWTEKDIETLTSLREKGTAWSVIAKRLGRSQRACQLKQTHLRSRAQLCTSTKLKPPPTPAFGRRKPFFEKNPETAEAVLAAYQAHKKAFWQTIAREVGCSWTAAERKVMDLLQQD